MARKHSPPAGAPQPPEPDVRGEVGRRGEDLAARFLVARGFRIAERNWRPSSGAASTWGERLKMRGELDVIAWDGEALCFVEVKTRTSREWGTPAQAVHSGKQRQIVRLAQAYLALRAAREPQVWEVACRFDVVEVWLCEGEVPRVALHKGAFDATPTPPQRQF